LKRGFLMDGKSGAEIVARIVKKQGARYVFFGVCGGHISPLGLAFMREGIEVISTRVEPTAGFAGDAMARLTGVPAVAVGTAGPGVTNLVTPIVNAYLAQSPLVVLGGATGTLLRGKGSLQDIDQLSVLKSYTKFCARAGSVNEIPALLKTAFEAAMSDAPGPVFLELPSDVIYPAAIVEKEYGSFIGVEPREISIRRILGHLKAGKFGQAGREMYIRRHIKHVLREPQSEELPVLPHREKISPDEVAGVGKLLSRARRPVLILGSQINWSSYKRRLLEFVEKLGLPVYLIGMARGGLGRNHPLLFALSRKKALKIADLVIVAGVSFDLRERYFRSR
jgi:thiamine pyrophosphate-dependent acetolactate synthase large subunit-like protein